MSQRAFGAWVLAGVLAGTPVVGLAQIMPGLAAGCCETCHLPPVQCHCAQTRPVVTTKYRQEQVTTYRDVAETQYRRESYVERVPVTTYRNETVDAGGYQMVWVPKPVTRQVAQTTVTEHVRTREVPVTVMRRVPEVSTRVVPYQSVEHVTEMIPTMAAAPVHTCHTGCDHGHLGYGGHGHATGWLPPATAFGGPYPTALAPLPETAILPHSQSALRDSEWETVRPRGSYSDGPIDGGPRRAPQPAPDSHGDHLRPIQGLPPKTSMFAPASGSGALWSTRTASYTR